MHKSRAGLWTIVLSVGLAAGIVHAQATGPERIQISNTDKVDFPGGGTLHVKNAIGELTIEGWDEPGMEITTIKSSKDVVEPKDRDKINKLLGAVKVSSERKGDEVVVTSDFPRHPKIERMFHGLTEFALEYRIRVPRSARVIVEESIGETHIDNVTGELHATVKMGEITVHVPDGQYAIDAKSKFGSVDSDFPGQEQRKKLLGKAFLATPAAPTQKIFLRIGFGDIVILKIH